MMIQSFLNILCVVCFALHFSCGTKVGNPMQSSGSSNGGGTTKKEVSPPPKVEISAAQLVRPFFSGKPRPEVDNSLTKRLSNVQEILESSDAFLQKYDLEQIQIVRSTGNKRADKVSVTSIGKTYVGTICRGSDLLARLLWSDGSINFNLIITEKAVDMSKYEMVRFTYTGSALEVLSVDLDQKTSGQELSSDKNMRAFKNPVSSRNSIESLKLQKNNLDSNLYQSVTSQFSEYQGQTSFTADQYGVGVVSNKDKTNSRFLKYDDDCKDRFSEDDPESSWCKIGNVFERSERFIDSESDKEAMKKTWEVLESSGVRSQSTLSIPPEFFEKSVCDF